MHCTRVFIPTGKRIIKNGKEVRAAMLERTGLQATHFMQMTYNFLPVSSRKFNNM